jgi:hypothetical protein
MPIAHSHRPARWWQWRNRTRIIFTLVVTMIVWGATDVRSRGRVDPSNPVVHRTDFTVYTEAGAAFFDGRDPYRVTNPRGWGYLYPPLFAMFVAPLHAFGTQTQVVVWFAISVFLVWGCYRESVRIARAVMPGEPDRGSFGPLPGWIGCSALMAAALPALNCLQRGQVEVLKLYLLLLGFRILVGSPSARRALAAGAVFAAPIVLKITPLIVVGTVSLGQAIAGIRERRGVGALRPVAAGAAGTLFGLVVGVFLLPAALLGWSANLHHLDSWFQTVAKNAERSTVREWGDSYSIRNQSLTNAVCRFGNWAHYCCAAGPPDSGGPPNAEGKRGLIMESPAVGSALRGVCLVEGGLLLWAVWRIAGSKNPLNLAATFGMACASTLVVAPIARGHYYVLMLPAVMFTIPWLDAHGHRRLAIGMALAPPLLATAHYLQMTVAGRVGLLGIGTAIWFTVGTLAMIRLGPLGARRRDVSMIDKATTLAAPHGTHAMHVASNVKVS